MAIYFTSDLHFNHDVEFIWKARGFNSIEEMNENIIKHFNERVTAEDDVYILGDLCLGGGSKEVMEQNKSLIERLNGKLHIIRGNHDTDRRMEMYKTCSNIVECGGLWADYIKYNGYHFYMSHFPTITSNLEKESLKQCTCCLFGHTHQTTNFYYDMPMVYHVGVDSHDCYPCNLDDIIIEMKEKAKECLNLV